MDRKRISSILRLYADMLLLVKNDKEYNTLINSLNQEMRKIIDEYREGRD